MSEKRQQKGISRRTLVKGAAWAVPAVPIVVATPAYASSPQCIDVSLGSGCKWEGANEQWSYSLELCFSNSCGGTYQVWIERLENNSGSVLQPCSPTDSYEALSPWTVPPGGDCFGPYNYSQPAGGNSAAKIRVFGWIGVKGAPGTEYQIGADIPTSGPNQLPACTTANPCL